MLGNVRYSESHCVALFSRIRKTLCCSLNSGTFGGHAQGLGLQGMGLIEFQRKWYNLNAHHNREAHLSHGESVEILLCRGYSWGWPIFLKKIIYFNWRIITLQYCDGFCYILTWISHGYTCVPPYRSLLPPPSPPHPSGLYRSTGFECPASWMELGTGHLFYIW